MGSERPVLGPLRRGAGMAVRWRRRSPPFAPALLRILARGVPDATVVQIGANDGDRYDPLRDHIEGSRWRGVLVEPVPHIHAQLAERYKDHPRIAVEQVAIAQRAGSQPFFHLRQVDEAEARTLPPYYDALGSFRRDVVASHVADIPDVEERIQEISVQTVTFDDLCRQHGLEHVDLLHIDTEGYDLAILETVDLRRYQPRILAFEVFHLTPEERQRAADILRSAGYLWFEESLDWWCVSTSHRDATQRILERAARWILDGHPPGRVLGFPGKEPDPLGAAARRGKAAVRVLRHGTPASPRSPVDTAEPEDRRILEHVAPLTMTGPERQLALLDMVEHVIRCDVPGDFVECGVWRGGSVLAMALKLQQLGAAPRDLYLYDTFDGMTEPTAADTSRFHPPAVHEWNRAEASGAKPYPELFNAEDETLSADVVVQRLLDVGYPRSRIHVVQGPVEETIPGTVPDRIALLRLDTDWYESTRHELIHLYPLLSSRGGLLIDDYGHWDGCAKAVEEYFAGDPNRPLLQRVDYTMRMGVRP